MSIDLDITIMPFVRYEMHNFTAVVRLGKWFSYENNFPAEFWPLGSEETMQYWCGVLLYKKCFWMGEQLYNTVITY